MFHHAYLLPVIVYAHGRRLCSNWFRHGRTLLLSTPMGVDYVVIGFDMEVQLLRERCLHRCREQSFAIRAYAMSAVGIDVVSRHTVSQDSRMHCKVQMNEWPLILWRFNCISTKEWDATRPAHLCFKPTKEDFSVGF